MRIVNLKTFIEMPTGTIFMKYAPMYFGELQIKGESINHGSFAPDFNCTELVCIENNGSTDWSDKIQSMVDQGLSMPLDMEYWGRDGMFEPSQLFAVLEKTDLEKIVGTLCQYMEVAP